VHIFSNIPLVLKQRIKLSSLKLTRGAKILTKGGLAPLGPRLVTGLESAINTTSIGVAKNRNTF